MRHVMVYSESGRCGGWPANNGAWSWGDEILVGFDSAEHQERPFGFHQVKTDAKGKVVQRPGMARSLDGGETWTIEWPEALAAPPESAKRQTLQPIDFDAPGFCMTLRMSRISGGTSRVFYSADRGKTWTCPYRLPLLRNRGVMARTDYIVEGPESARVFLTAAKSNGREGRPFCAGTRNGGLTWRFYEWIGDEPECDGFAIMPSSAHVDDEEILVAVREHLEIYGRLSDESFSSRCHTQNRIVVYRNSLAGEMGEITDWRRIDLEPIDTGGKSGNPAHLIRLRNGKFCLTYGYRTKPFDIRALLFDLDTDWSKTIVLRTGGACHDFGYPRTVQRPDGKLVTVYYWCPTEFGERTIEATIWEA